MSRQRRDASEATWLHIDLAGLLSFSALSELVSFADNASYVNSC